jgi:hypothetical protein
LRQALERPIRRRDGKPARQAIAFPLGFSPMALEPAHVFERDNRPISDWLLALISPEPALGERASLILTSMQIGVVDPNVDITPEMLPSDTDAHRAAFGAAIRAAVDAPDFPRRAYVQALMRFMEEARDRSSAQFRQNNQRIDRVVSKIQARMTDASVEQLEREQRRLIQALCASVESKTAPAMPNAPIWAGVVFNQLDHALLEAPEQLSGWLGGRGSRPNALEAIQRIGPAAVGFAPQLLAELDALAGKDEAWWWDGVHALAVAGRDDVTTIGALASRLEGAPGVAGNAVAVLGTIGRGALAVVPDLVERLLELSRHEVEFVRLASFGALGALGAGRTDAAGRLVEAITNGTGHEPGYAIDAINPEILPAAKAVPLLIGLFGRFEEFDPDREYQGEHARLAEALARYGPAAAQAVPQLVLNLGTPESLNESVIRCLGAIGPEARDAAPPLEKAARAAGIENIATDDTHVGHAWRTITS